jgi:phenylalanine-4-hydroxylase
MAKKGKYISREADEAGFIDWSVSENKVWEKLINTQIEKIQGRVCAEYIQGLHELNLPLNRIPQLEEVSSVLRRKTGWEVEAVPCLISFDRFFELLAARKFPCATFIRRPEDMLYLQEPDIFHEIFGHCPMLTDSHFADFTARYGRLGKKATHKERVMLARLYWFTVEFGLIKRNSEMKIYGGGIISSIGETDYALSGKSQKSPLELTNVLRTPYRIDIMQPEYFYIEKFADFEELKEKDIMDAVHQAAQLGLFKPKYSPKSA